MKFCVPFHSDVDFSSYTSRIDVLFGHKGLSRLGKMSTEELIEGAKKVRELGHRAILEWDVLMTQDRFDYCEKLLESIDLFTFDCVRVLDPGALGWCKNKKLQIQLILEGGNHNLTGIKKWISIAGESLERIVLSLEIPQEKLKSYCQEISCPVEFQAFGPLLLFYSPRPLLSAVAPEKDLKSFAREGWIKAEGKSEETPHKGFTLIESFHGTFMYHPKDHNLLPFLSDLKETGVAVARLESRHRSTSLENDIFSILLNPENTVEKFLERWPVKTIRGFWGKNKSDVLFKKLKNQNNKREDGPYLGEIMDVKKGSYIALKVKSSQNLLKKGQEITIKTPEGKVKQTVVKRITALDGSEIEQASANQIVILPHVQAVSIRSSVFQSNLL